MLNHKQTAVALVAIVLMIFSTSVPGAYAQLHGGPTYQGSHPIIHNHISPAANVAFSTSVPAQLPVHIIQLFVRPAVLVAGFIIAEIECQCGPAPYNPRDVQSTKYCTRSMDGWILKRYQISTCVK